MQRKNRVVWGFTTLAALALFALAIAFPAASPVMAQTEPTPTPNDPLWLAFVAVRDAIQEEKSVDLFLVRAWDWEQTEWTDGIDSCKTLEDPLSARQLYWGWTFTITSLNGATYQGRISFNREIVVVCDQVVTAAAPTAVPGATANPNLPPPVAGSAAGGAFELGGHALELNAGTVKAMKDSGMTWVKKQVRFNVGEDPAAKVSGIINSAKSNGFKMLIGLVGNKDQMGDYNAYINSYASFAAGVARAGADAIEVWNEPNIDREWPAGQINGGTYTRMLAAAFNAIKQANANTIVVSGAPAPTGFFGAAGCTAQGCNDDVFMQQMAQAGAAQYMDCIGLHYNEGIIAPTAATGDPRGTYPSYYFGSMLARGYNPFGGKQVCWTELGYLSPEGFSSPLPASFAWAQNTTVAQQASWLADAARLSAQSGRVRLMIVWNVDFPFYTATDPMGGYGMIRPGGGCPACASLGTVMRR